jgi:hypothetical protein
MLNPMPEIVRVDGRPRFMVDGEPFLILGLQWACESCFHVAEMNPLFAEAARLGANTAALPLYWREVEPEPGRYDMAMLDERLARAREHGLRLVLLWFATWKNAHHFMRLTISGRTRRPTRWRSGQTGGRRGATACAPRARRPGSATALRFCR